MKSSLHADITFHPIVDALNPHRQRFIAMRWLSPRLNPFLCSHKIEIGAAVAFMGGFPHIKVVAAFGMMAEDHKNGLYNGIETLVVPSSGNTGHGAALLAPTFGISRVKVIMASDTPEAKKSIIALIPWAGFFCPPGAQSVEEAALEEAGRPGAYLLDQYKHPGNARIHEECTGPQLLDAVDAEENGEIGLVAAGMGSGGTITGISHYFKRAQPGTIMLGVRPKEGRRVPGVRDAKQMDAVVTIPYQEAVNAIETVGRDEAFLKARELLSEVQPQVGPSSGLAYVGLLQYLEKSPVARESLRGKSAVFICPDDGRFYPGPTHSTRDPDQGL
jgi:cysteine synthase A